MSERIHVEVQGGAQPPRRGGFSFFLLLPGLFFIAFGVLVFVVPELLTYMVSAAFIMVGLGLCIGALKVRRVSQRFSMFEDQFPQG